MLTRDHAICLRAVDYSETSQVVTLFTRGHGKLSAIAKGSKRPKSDFGGPIERLSRGEVVFAAARTGQLATLTEFLQVHDVIAALSRDLEAYYCGLLGTELLTKLTEEHDPHPELYDRYQGFLLDVTDVVVRSERREQLLGLLILFQWFLLKDSGILPHFTGCVHCNLALSERWPAVYFSSAADGLLCRDCEMHYPHRLQVLPPVASTLADVSQLSKVGYETVRSTEKLLISHFTYLLGQRPKMAKFLELEGEGNR